MKNPILPKVGYIYSDIRGFVYRISRIYYDSDMFKQIEIQLLINPKQTKIISYDDFISAIDYDEHPNLKGHKIWNYELLSTY